MPYLKLNQQGSFLLHTGKYCVRLLRGVEPSVAFRCTAAQLHPATENYMFSVQKFKRKCVSFQKAAERFYFNIWRKNYMNSIKSFRVPGDEEEFNKGKKSENVLKIVLYFVLFFICVIITGLMIYNYFKTGSVFPVTVSQDVILSLKSFKGFKTV